MGSEHWKTYDSLDDYRSGISSGTVSRSNDEIFAEEDRLERERRDKAGDPTPTGGYVDSSGRLRGDHGLSGERLMRELGRLGGDPVLSELSIQFLADEYSRDQVIAALSAGEINFADANRILTKRGETPLNNNATERLGTTNTGNRRHIQQTGPDNSTKQDKDKLDRAIKAVLPLAKAGVFDPSNRTTFLSQIQEFLGVTPEEASEVYDGLFALEERLFEQQQLSDVRQRGVSNAFGNSFGSFSPLGQRALNTGFNTFMDVQPITNFFNNQELGDAFQGFLGGAAPTSQGLTASIDQILNSVRGNLNADDLNNPALGDAANFRARFDSPESVLSAAIQPFLRDVAPRLRGNVASVLEDAFGSKFASNPVSYQTPDQMFSLFDALRGSSLFRGL